MDPTLTRVTGNSVTVGLQSAQQRAPCWLIKTHRHEVSAQVCSVLQLYLGQAYTHAVKTRHRRGMLGMLHRLCSLFLRKKYTIVFSTDRIVKLELSMTAWLVAWLIRAEKIWLSADSLKLNILQFDFWFFGRWTDVSKEENLHTPSLSIPSVSEWLFCWRYQWSHWNLFL